VDPFRLVLTRGGGAELIDVLDDEEVVWASDDDPEFQDEFEGEFLGQDDVADILDYLVEVGELSKHEADRCVIEEEYYEASELTGMFGSE